MRRSWLSRLTYKDSFSHLFVHVCTQLWLKRSLVRQWVHSCAFFFLTLIYKIISHSVEDCMPNWLTKFVIKRWSVRLYTVIKVNQKINTKQNGWLIIPKRAAMLIGESYIVQKILNIFLRDTFIKLWFTCRQNVIYVLSSYYFQLLYLKWHTIKDKIYAFLVRRMEELSVYFVKNRGRYLLLCTEARFSEGFEIL